MKHLIIPSLLVSLLATGCVPDEPPAPASNGTEAEGPTNRIATPAVVRRNLGITFAAAEYRPVAATITLPGHFEVLPSAQHHYPTPAAGRVTVRVEPLDAVKKGQLLLEVDAPDWRELQLELVDTFATRLGCDAKLARARAARLAAGTLSEPSTDPSEDIPDVFTVEIQAAEAAVGAARDRFEQLLAKAATLTGLSVAELSAESAGMPEWRRLDHIPIHATEDGVVREVEAATGTWVGEGTEVIHVVHPETLRFRAKALQADLIDRIRDGQLARIVPPEGRGDARRGPGLTGAIRIGVTGDPETRTSDVFIDCPECPVWVRPQVVALAEVIVEGEMSATELAIPARALIQDGLEMVFFRRDPKDPDTVIRTVADLGPTDGRWTTIYSGLAPGNEVVVDGIYQLKLATSGRKMEAGHFHADGTFHEGED